MELKVLPQRFSVCKVTDFSQAPLEADYCFLGKTDEERSLVCETALVPGNCTHREDGWRAFRVEGVLDFSLVGILSRLSALLAEHGVSIFAVSTYNTDYILVKEAQLDCALAALKQAGYPIRR